MDTKKRGSRAKQGDIAADRSVRGPNRREFIAAACAAGLVPSFVNSREDRGTVAIVRDIQPATALGTNPMGVALDLALAALTGAHTPDAAWKQVAGNVANWSLKIETRSPLAASHPLLVSATLDHLFAAGVRPWQTTVWDKRAADVRRAAMRLSTGQGEIAVVSGEPRNQGDTEAAGYRSDIAARFPAKDGTVPNVHLNERLAIEDGASINLPTLRQHPRFGVDGALAAALACVNGISGLLADAETLPDRLAMIWDQLLVPRHRLTVMDATWCVFEGGPVGLASWRARENALIVGFDPVAVDVVAIELIDARRAAVGLPPVLPLAQPFLTAAEKAGLGITTPVIIRLNAPQR